MQGWWGHSANQITGGDTQPIRLQVGTLSQSDYTRVVCKDACARVAHAGGACRGGRDTQPFRTGGAWRGARRGARRCVEGLPLVAPSNH